MRLLLALRVADDRRESASTTATKGRHDLIGAERFGHSPSPLPITKLARLVGVSGGHRGLGLLRSPGSVEDGGMGEAAGIGEAGGIGDAAGMGVGTSVTTSHYQQFMKYASTVMNQDPPQGFPRWDFLTNHAHVLVCIARDPGIRLREIAAAVGITERAAHRIVSELVDEHYVVRERQGRRNHYEVKTELPLRHPLAREREVGDLLDALIGSTSRVGSAARVARGEEGSERGGSRARGASSTRSKP